MRPKILLSIFVLITVAPLFAQTDSDDRADSPSPLQWSLGLGVLSSPRPYVGAENSTFPAPLLELSYKNLFVQGIQAGFRLFDNDTFSVDARARIVFNGLDPEDSEFLVGMNKRRSTIEGGFVGTWKPGKFRVSAGLYTDLLGRYYGQQATADLSRTWTFNRYRWGLTPSIGLIWQSGNFVDYYYGVTPDEALPDRPPFEGHAAVNLNSSIFAYFFLTMRIRLTGYVRVQRLDNEISDSPIVDQPRGIFGLVGVTYRFGKLPPRPR
jgi:outer membrane protein